MGSLFGKGKGRERGEVRKWDLGYSVKEKGEGEKPLPLPTALHTRERGLLEGMCVGQGSWK